MLFFWFTVSSDGDASDKSTIISKSEKKTRKAMRKLGMHPITGVSRVTLRNEKNVSLILMLEPFTFNHVTLTIHFASPIHVRSLMLGQSYV